MTERQFCHGHVTPWLKNQGIFYRRIRGWHDYLVCINGKLIVLEAKRSAKANRQATQWRDKKVIEAAGGLWFWVYPENWEEVKNNLRRLTNGYVK